MFIIQRARFGVNNIIIRLLTSFIQEAQHLAHNLRRMNTYVDGYMSIFILKKIGTILFYSLLPSHC